MKKNLLIISFFVFGFSSILCLDKRSLLTKSLAPENFSAYVEKRGDEIYFYSNGEKIDIPLSKFEVVWSPNKKVAGNMYLEIAPVEKNQFVHNKFNILLNPDKGKCSCKFCIIEIYAKPCEDKIFGPLKEEINTVSSTRFLVHKNDCFRKDIWLLPQE
jgi:hypothetical protein